MTLQQRISLLVLLGNEIKSRPEWLQDAVDSAYHANRWFTQESSWNSLESIAEQYLNRDTLAVWTDQYAINDSSNKKVGLVLAGNIPMVGFHDVLCCFVSGHIAMAKLSSKDEILMRAVISRLIALDPAVSDRIIFVDKLKGFDAIIATGSNNSSTYFEEYFGKYPNIIRRNRNAVAVLDGSENEQDIIALGEDVFTYFGLGCRNVAKLYVPEGYNFEYLLGILHEHYKELANHDKYRNNFDYNNALFMLNKVEYLMSGSLIITESKDITSRIATVHYEFYDSLEELQSELVRRKDEIQCVVSNANIVGFPSFPFGEAQQPSIDDYADGVDTMAFLVNL